MVRVRQNFIYKWIFKVGEGMFKKIKKKTETYANKYMTHWWYFYIIHSLAIGEHKGHFICFNSLFDIVINSTHMHQFGQYI